MGLAVMFIVTTHEPSRGSYQSDRVADDYCWGRVARVMSVSRCACRILGVSTAMKSVRWSEDRKGISRKQVPSYESRPSAHPHDDTP